MLVLNHSAILQGALYFYGIAILGSGEQEFVGCFWRSTFLHAGQGASCLAMQVDCWNVEQTTFRDGVWQKSFLHSMKSAPTPLSIYTWALMHCECMQTKDEDMVPLTINCWPSISGNESYVNIEYECQADFDLQNIVVAIPCHQPPKINQVTLASAIDASYQPVGAIYCDPICPELQCKGAADRYST